MGETNEGVIGMKSEERIKNEMQMYKDLLPELSDERQRKECIDKIRVLCWVLKGSASEDSVCALCEAKQTNSCNDRKVEFKREYKEGDNHTYHIHRNFIEDPQKKQCANV